MPINALVILNCSFYVVLNIITLNPYISGLGNFKIDRFKIKKVKFVLR